MRFFLDENLPLLMLNIIRELGFQVENVKGVGLQGVKDKEIAEYAIKNKAILVTKDLEFGNLILYPKNSHYGLIILRLPNNFSTEQAAKLIKDFLMEINVKSLINKIIILGVGRYRIRKI